MKNIISQDRVLKLNNPNVTDREYDVIIKEIGERVHYVWTELLKISGRKLKWHGFQNNGPTDWEDEHSEGDGGCFNPDTDSNFIDLVGDYASREVDGDFAYGFPTRFLWTENIAWKQEVLNHIAHNKRLIAHNERLEEVERLKAVADEIARQNIIVSIKSKLTKEELKYISFK